MVSGAEESECEREHACECECEIECEQITGALAYSGLLQTDTKCQVHGNLHVRVYGLWFVVYG